MLEEMNKTLAVLEAFMPRHFRGARQAYLSYASEVNRWVSASVSENTTIASLHTGRIVQEQPETIGEGGNKADCGEKPDTGKQLLPLLSDFIILILSFLTNNISKYKI